MTLHHHTFIRLALLVGLLVVATLPRQTQAQDVIEDTLDWRGYYPLQVGNQWEYEIKRGPLNQFSDFERREITGDTLIDDTRYVIHEVQRYKLLDEPDSTLELRWAATDYVRYDTARAMLYAIPADSARLHDRTDQMWPGSPFIYDYVAEPLTCKLSADFGERLTCESSVVDPIEVVVDGGYLDRTDRPIPIRARKGFVGSSTEVGFEHGLGEVFGRLIYVRIDGQESGESTVTRLDAEPPLKQAADLGFLIYPNPVRDAFTVRFSLTVPERVVVEVFDVLGRCVHRERLPLLPAGEHTRHLEVSSLPAGIYLLRLTGSLAQGTEAFVVTK